jgi:hypothetical protein
MNKEGIKVAATRERSKWSANEDPATPLKIIAGIAR